MTCRLNAAKLYKIAKEWVNPPDFFDDDVPDTLLNYFGYVFDKPLLEECLKP